MASSINADNGVSSGSAGLKSSADSSGVLALQTNGTTALSIDASQNVSFTNQPTYSGGTANGVAYLNGSKVLTTGSALVFDGTNLGLGGTTNSYGSQTAMTLSGTNVSRIDFRSNSTFTGTILSYQAVTEGLRLQTEAGYPITFYPAGTKAATIDTAGNLGLGVTPSAWGSVWKSIDVGNSGGITSPGTNDMRVMANAYNNGTNWKYKNSTAASLFELNGGGFNWQIAGAGTAGNNITFTQAMTLDASGNWILGGTTARTRITLQVGEANAPTLGTASGGAFFGNSNVTYGTLFGTSGSGYGWIQQQRVDGTGTAYDLCLQPSGGNLLVGTTSATFSGATRQFVVNNSGGYAAGFGNTSAGAETVVIQNADTTGTRRFVVFKAGTSGVGEITSNGSTTTYGTTSDYRLKENVAPMIGALAKVAALKPCTYTWKATGEAGEGFIAHELAEIAPDAVTGEKDGTRIEQYEINPAVPATFDGEGNELTPAVEAVMGEREVPAYQGIDTSFLVATLTAAIQEMKEIIDTQASTITQLQADVAALKGASA